VCWGSEQDGRDQNRMLLPGVERPDVSVLALCSGKLLRRAGKTTWGMRFQLGWIGLIVWVTPPNHISSAFWDHLGLGLWVRAWGMGERGKRMPQGRMAKGRGPERQRRTYLTTTGGENRLPLACQWRECPTNYHGGIRRDKCQTTTGTKTSAKNKQIPKLSKKDKDPE